MKNINTDSTLALVTGATSGIGRETAFALAEKGYSLILVSRNEEKAQKLIDDIHARQIQVPIYHYQADLSQLKQVEKVANQIKDDFPKIDILINNAGLVNQQKVYTPEGFEYTLAVNHLAPFLLTIMLIELLKKSEEGRIINVSSNAHKMARPDWGDFNYEKRKYHPMYVYGDTKLYNILFSQKLSELLKESTVTVNSLHPGFVNSNFGKQSKIWRTVLIFMRPFMINPEKGAQTTVYLATEASVSEETGRYYVNKKPKSPSGLAKDPQVAELLWNKTILLIMSKTDITPDKYMPSLKK